MKPLLFLGEARGQNEERIGSSFVGSSGIELLKMADEAKLLTLTSEDMSYIYRFWKTHDPNMIECVWQMHPEVYRANVFNRHPPGDKIENFCGPRAEGIQGYPALTSSKYVRAEFIPELERLADEICAVDPNLIVALGNTALWALCGNTGIGKLRGSTRLSTHTAQGFKVLPTYHPAAVLRQWDLRPTTVIDLTKAAREQLFPEIRRPRRVLWIAPTLDDLLEFERLHIRDFLSVDIENPGGPITEITFAPSPSLGLVLPFVRADNPGRHYWGSLEEEVRAWSWARGLLENPAIAKAFQNGLYDVAVLWRQMGIKTFNFVDDSMLLHHALQPESLKSLGFLGSIYTDEGAWKSERPTKFTSWKKDD